jgi:hypothetical protein
MAWACMLLGFVESRPENNSFVGTQRSPCVVSACMLLGVVGTAVL